MQRKSRANSLKAIRPDVVVFKAALFNVTELRKQVRHDFAACVANRVVAQIDFLNRRVVL